MKRQLIYLFAPTALLAAGCAEKETGADAKGFGRIAVSAAADATLITRSSGAATVPAVEEFRFSLRGEGYEGEWQSVAEFSQTDTTFREGTYTARIAYGDPEEEGIDKAFFTGEQTFELLPRRANPVSVTARIANSQTLIRATEQFLAYFHDAQFTVTTGSGNTYAFTPGAATADAPVFVQAGTSLTVTGTAHRQSQTGTEEGPEIEFSVQSLAATKPRTCHIFTFDAANAGSAQVTILLSEGESTIEPVIIELNDEAIKDENK